MSHRFEINRNGDSARSLMEEFIAVMRASEVLEAALRKVTTHGRNYQTLPEPEFAFNVDNADKARMLNDAMTARNWALDGALKCMRHIENT